MAGALTKAVIGADQAGPGRWPTPEPGLLQPPLDRLTRGIGGGLLIEGEPGPSRSTLVTTVAEQARAHEITVLTATADEMSRHFPLLVLQDALCDETLTSVEQVLRRLAELVATGPVLLILDDLQWADETTLLAWYRLARLARSSALLLVGSLRPDVPREELGRLRRALASLGTELVTLPPLTEERGRATPTELPAPTASATGSPSDQAVPTPATRTGGRKRREDRLRPFAVIPPPPNQSGWTALTRAEKNIAELVAEGHTNADIAARLYVSRRTVEGHVSHVLAKLGLRSRVELARDVGRRRPARTS